MTISVNEAVDLIALIKTKSENTWRDKTIDAVVRKVAAKFGNKVALKFRSAKRVVREEGIRVDWYLERRRISKRREGKCPHAMDHVSRERGR